MGKRWGRGGAERDGRADAAELKLKQMARNSPLLHYTVRNNNAEFSILKQLK